MSARETSARGKRILLEDTQKSSRVGILKVRAGRRNLLQTLLLCSGGEGLPFQLEKLTSIRAHEDLAGRKENTWWLRHGVQQRPENKKKARYLLGESMGGATVLLLHRKEPSYWNGAVLVAPMCKVRSNQYCYKGKPRLKTAHELLLASLDIEQNLHQVSLPFLVLHGGDDIVTDPSVSKLLYETASSEDKTFKLYPGMWHALTSGEPPENINLVFSDIIAWLDQRTATRDPTSEMELKAKHDEDAHSKTSQIHG
ncbi:hypothetical protein B296_00046156 [Ensete ventricosum]|uniref:Serine aminopeptidase S33 domain-containing protein n=1 Tax=Ensete ventricosum TaxID=4639 RepID=A0A426YKJ4_ENSVE|nr:hypothetical protein B296_00046156 [Ensete ventricosum]